MASPEDDALVELQVHPSADGATGDGDGEAARSSQIVTVRPPNYAIRTSLRPPVRFTPGTDLELWMKQFELYVKRIGVAKEQWTRELLPLLDDEPFRVIDQLGLVESTDYDAMIAHLKQQYSLAGNEFEWQFRLQKRVQRSGESLVEYAGSLRVLADKAYPMWSPEQQRDALRNQFIQGMQSSSVQLHLMREKPISLDAALEVAIQRENVEAAQKRLQKEKQKSESLMVQGREEDSLETNALTGRGAQQPALLEDLAQQVRHLSEEVARLRTGKQPTESRSGVICWGCKERGHIRRNCPKKSGRSSKSSSPANQYKPRVAAVSSTLYVDGWINEQPTSMLVDTGSAACIVQEDIWRSTSTQSDLRPPAHPVVTANAGEMTLLGLTDVELTVRTLMVHHPVLVASDLAQSCLLEADFLKKYGCIIAIPDQHRRLATNQTTSTAFALSAASTCAWVIG